eukprot:scaffold1102_cov256-Pinguiococcus_pyrenoidosus.AAC.35
MVKPFSTPTTAASRPVLRPASLSFIDVFTTIGPRQQRRWECGRHASEDRMSVEPDHCVVGPGDRDGVADGVRSVGIVLESRRVAGRRQGVLEVDREGVATFEKVVAVGVLGLDGEATHVARGRLRQEIHVRRFQADRLGFAHLRRGLRWVDGQGEWRALRGLAQATVDVRAASLHRDAVGAGFQDFIADAILPAAHVFHHPCDAHAAAVLRDVDLNHVQRVFKLRVADADVVPSIACLDEKLGLLAGGGVCQPDPGGRGIGIVRRARDDCSSKGRPHDVLRVEEKGARDDLPWNRGCREFESHVGVASLLAILNLDVVVRASRQRDREAAPSDARVPAIDFQALVQVHAQPVVRVGIEGVDL